MATIFIYFIEKLAEATRKFQELVAEVGVSNQGNDNVDVDIERGSGSPSENGDTKTVLVGKTKQKNQKVKGTRKLKELKFAVSEFYLSLVLVQNFQVLYALFLPLCG